MRTTFGIAAVLLGLGGCAASPGVEAGAGLGAVPPPPIASVWRSRCGNCHVPVEPGSRQRQALEAALLRHQTRVKLTKDEWGQLSAWLALPSTDARR